MDKLNQKLLDALGTHAPLYVRSVLDTQARNPELYKELSTIMLQWVHDLLGDQCFDTLAQGYLAFVSDVNRCQARYQRKGAYPNKSYQEVYDSVYNNPQVMNNYHWGVYVTTFAWEHHLHLFNFYKQYFLPLIKDSTSILDLGSGSGIWSLLTAHFNKGSLLKGVDISETSVGLATSLTKTAGYKSRVEFICDDALKHGDKTYQAALSCFLVEHLEDPKLLFQSLNSQLVDGGYAWVTGALTAAESDHIFEIRKESELIQLAEESGFRVVSSMSLGPSDYPNRYRFLPRSMGMILQRKHNEIW